MGLGTKKDKSQAINRTRTKIIFFNRFDNNCFVNNYIN